MNVPGGFTTQNNVRLPVSVWFIGGLYTEAEALRVAQAYQGATGRDLRCPSAYVAP